eukprot:CAMPEP_0118928990 /NCGR_PEP_ID=MMETSP1169-20130426/6122_1 /TAXON_ID=36882 /ORGANISM="Pyramimonas obovata, Strain CCMP722" /LENGTH=570 /DNA_ID=CAMNT_0006871103 /DNA_START=38 /DNA_END=1746 /DNA_ORIENTATION=-
MNNPAWSYPPYGLPNGANSQTPPGQADLQQQQYQQQYQQYQQQSYQQQQQHVLLQQQQYQQQQQQYQQQQQQYQQQQYQQYQQQQHYQQQQQYQQPGYPQQQQQNNQMYPPQPLPTYATPSASQAQPVASSYPNSQAAPPLPYDPQDQPPLPYDPQDQPPMPTEPSPPMPTEPMPPMPSEPMPPMPTEPVPPLPQEPSLPSSTPSQLHPPAPNTSLSSHQQVPYSSPYPSTQPAIGSSTNMQYGGASASVPQQNAGYSPSQAPPNHQPQHYSTPTQQQLYNPYNQQSAMPQHPQRVAPHQEPHQRAMMYAAYSQAPGAQSVGIAPYAASSSPGTRSQVGWLQPNISQQQQEEVLKAKLENLATTVAAKTLFKPPDRAKRPRMIAVILRGLPGSGKTRVAQALRDVEVENGGEAPKIHSLDDYFMSEVEKEIVVEEVQANGKVTKRRKKVTEMEYEYEKEMEEAYKASLLKGLKRTAEEARFHFVIVDSCNIKVSDFAQQYSVLKAKGYECYILQPQLRDMDPKVCAARNVHGRTLTEVEALARDWEAAPPTYTRLDAASLFHDDPAGPAA